MCPPTIHVLYISVSLSTVFVFLYNVRGPDLHASGEVVWEFIGCCEVAGFIRCKLLEP